MPPTRAHLRAFLEAPSLAFAGARRSGQGFGSQLLRELVRQGYRVTPVHPEAPALEGLPCVASFEALERPLPLVVALPRAKALGALEAAAQAGIREVWLQQGSESPEALRLAERHGLHVVHGACLFMHLPDVRGIHRLHRGLWRLLGLLEAQA